MAEMLPVSMKERNPKAERKKPANPKTQKKFQLMKLNFSKRMKKKNLVIVTPFNILCTINIYIILLKSLNVKFLVNLKPTILIKEVSFPTQIKGWNFITIKQMILNRA